MPITQYARGTIGGFSDTENPFKLAGGMEQNLRLSDDLLGLYTVLPPVIPGTPRPGAPIDGQGQIYSDGSFDVFNAGSWKKYPPRQGVKAIQLDARDVWLSSGEGWVSMQLAADLNVARVAASIYLNTAEGLAATSDAEYFSIPSPLSSEFLILYRNAAGVAVEVKRYPSSVAIEGLAEATAAVADGVAQAESAAAAALAAQNIAQYFAQQALLAVQDIADSVAAAGQAVAAAGVAVAAADTAEAAAADAVAVVTGGTAQLYPQPGKLPIADGLARIPFGWSNQARVQRALQSAGERPVRVYHGGTSIEDSAYSGSRKWLEAVAKYCGDSGNEIQHLGVLGGDYNAAWLGWKKQPFVGYKFHRLRGEPSSGTLSFPKFFKRLVIRYSTEVGGSTCAVAVDGVSAGIVNCSGAQSGWNEFEVSFAEAKMRLVTIEPPASGYVYLEAIEWCVDRPGLHVVDGALGSSSLNNFINVRAATGAQVAGIAAADTTTALDNTFGRTSPASQLDLAIVGWCVNDAGIGLGAVNSVYAPALARIVAQTKAAKVPLILLIEMGGSYTMVNQTNHPAFVAIRNLLLSYAVEPHVTVIDWHAESRPDTIASWIDRFYPGVTVNEGAGTWTGDFIHPNTAAYDILTGMLCQATAIPTLGFSSYIDADVRRVISATPAVPGDVPAYSPSNFVGKQAFLSNTYGVPREYVCVGQAHAVAQPYQVKAALWYCAQEINSDPAINNLIAAAGTADEFGPFKTIPLTFFGVALPNWGSAQLVSVTLILGAGTTQIQVKNAANSAFLSHSVLGSVVPISGPVFFVNPTGKPQAVHFTVAQTAGLGLVLAGKVYGCYVTPTDFPCVTPRSADNARELTTPMLMVEDTPAAKVIMGQSYIESINGKMIEKVAIGREVYRPADGGAYGLYRLADKTGINRHVLVTQNVSGTVYEDKVGAYVQTSADNPTRTVGPVAVIDYDKIYTLSGRMFVPGNPARVWLYNGGTNAYLFLQPDLTWAAQAFGAGAVAIPAAASQGGKTIALTFAMPSLALSGGGFWTFTVASYTGVGSKWSPWVLCEGRSAVA